MDNTAVFNVRDFGAVGIAKPTEHLRLDETVDFEWIPYPKGLSATVYHPEKGKAYDSIGIQKAIDTAHQAGGGIVFVPAGDYLISPLQLRSNVNLHLSPGAKLWGSPNLDDYYVDEMELTCVDRGFGRADQKLSGASKQRLIWANNQENFGITGMGQISGQSPHWIFAWLATKPTDWIHDRPTDTILFDKCRRVYVEGISLLDTPSWSLVFSACRDIQVRGIRIESMDCINSDGIDLVDSSDATISDCKLHVTDDGICLKTMNPDATVRNVTVTNCIIRTLCNGFKLGTDSTGNYEDITVSNLVIQNSDDDAKAEGGINLCAYDGGRIRNVNVSNVVMRNVECPFYLVSNNRERQQKPFRTPRAGTMERISLTNILADGYKHTPFVVGHPDQPIRNVFLSNINLRKEFGFYDHVPPSPKPVERYPTPYLFGSREGDELPAHGLYMRDVREAVLRDMRVELSQRDARPTFCFERCEQVEHRA